MNKAASSISLKLSKESIAKMMDFYHDQKQETKNPYIVFFAKTENCAISIYSTNKVLFQGDGASLEASIWEIQENNDTLVHNDNVNIGSIKSKQPATNNQITLNNTNQENTVGKNRNTFIEHGGSDEVGTGDYFGPVCVCACVVTKEAYQAIQHLGVDDSKNLNDEKIRNIAPLIKNVVPYSLLVLPNKKYNEIHATYNMNGIKAMLHNQAYAHLKNKVKLLPELCVVDQFTPERSYFRYLKNEKTIVRNLHFETKAESKYLAVACASVIAREAFLMAMDQLSEAYDMILPKGAGSLVDTAIQVFIDKHGFEQLRYVAKLHFANTSKVMEKPTTLF